MRRTGSECLKVEGNEGRRTGSLEDKKLGGA